MLPSEESFIDSCSARSFWFLPARFPLLVFFGAGDRGSPPSVSEGQFHPVNPSIWTSIWQERKRRKLVFIIVILRK
jgi:hypothetical protein